jgi:hypothetical protein
MVRLVTLHRELAVDVRLFFAHFWQTSTFAVELHRSLGDTSVDASDWIAIGPGKAQRLLFFSRNEDGTSTRCIETQSYALKESGDFDIKILVNPENPLGQVFRIEANWTVRAAGGSSGSGSDGASPAPTTAAAAKTVVDVSLEVECKKRLWGGYGNSLVEGMLEKSARKEYDDWFGKCASELEAMTKKTTEEEEEGTDVRLQVVEPPPEPVAASVFSRHALRHKASTLGHTAVRGAERFMSALLEHAPGQDVDESRPLIHIPVDGKRAFLAPVFSPGSPLARRPLYRRPLFVLFLILSLIAAALWYFFK